MIAELHDGRELEFPDGTDPAVVQATVRKVLGSGTPKSEPPSYPAVIGNALNKFIGGTVDMAGNLGANIWNLGANTLTNHPEASVETPDYGSKAMQKFNLVRPEAEPQTFGQEIADRATQTGAGMLLSPAKTGIQALKNLITGIISGTDSAIVKKATGSESLATASGMMTPATVQAMGSAGRQRVAAAMENRAKNAVRDDTLAAGRGEGYVVPGSLTNPSALNTAIESVAGKAAIKQEASLRNSTITEQVANRDINLPEETSLTPGKLKDVAHKAAEPYRQLAAIEQLPGYNIGGKSAKDLLAELATARFNAKALYKNVGDPDLLRQAAAETAKAKMIEDQLERVAEKSGQPGLVDEIREARALIAKTHDIENNLNLGDSGVSAPGLGRDLKDGRPLTGGLNTIARMAEAFPQVMREKAHVPSAGPSGTNPIAAAGLGMGGAATAGPVGWAMAGIPLLRAPARSIALSPYYQRHFATPNYGQGKYMSQIPDATNPEVALQAALIGAIQARKQQGKE